MKYLIDNQLPPALVRHLEEHGLECHHVAEIGLDEASDRDIWRHAAANGYAIVSKDEDFLHLASTDPSGPPLIWVRLGNCRKAAMLAAFDRVLPALIQALQEGNKVLEVR